MIETGQPSLKLAFFFITTFLVHVSQADLPSPDDPSGNCILSFKQFPYQGSGECLAGYQESVKVLGSIRTTLCCQNVLNALTKSLALQSNTSNYLFITQDQWKNCSGNFLRQNSASPQSCGFDKFYNGSSKCSSFPLSSFQQEWSYRNAIDSCSNFGSSFDDGCNKCTEAILDAGNQLFLNLNVEDDDGIEKATCAVAVIISVVAAKYKDPTFMDDFYSCLPALDQSPYDKDGYVKLKASLVKAVGAILIAVFTLMLILLLIQHVSKSNQNPRKPIIRTKEITAWSGLYRFSKAEIENAINYGNQKKSLGRGSAGQVYKGVLPSGQVVAIKHIHKSNSSDSFQREVEGLSRVRHPNLVCLFGCCIEGGDRYLVYEYCSAGNLAQHLLRKDVVLTWDTRVKILRACALALRYLHRFIDGCIVHRDIKLTNILLTENLEPKLSDFGLAKTLGMEESKVFTDVRGTIGYMDPEYMSNAKLTCASDIYSFGIVTLQLLSGQKVIELDLDARDQLTRKAKDVSAGTRPLTDFEDPRLNGKINRADFEAILNIAVLCVAKSSRGRPSIDDVFEVMEKASKNTAASMINNRETSSLQMSRSLEVIPV